MLVPSKRPIHVYASGCPANRAPPLLLPLLTGGPQGKGRPPSPAWPEAAARLRSAPCSGWPRAGC